MKKLFKALLASSMVLSLAACSSEDPEEIENDPEPEIEDPNWRENLDGISQSFQVYFNDELRDIIIQVEDNITLRFYFDQEAEENYSSIVIPFGTLDEETFFDNLFIMDFDSNGYDDIQFVINDDHQNAILVEYQMDAEYEVYNLVGFDSLGGIPDLEYVDRWYFNADPNENSFTVGETGNWIIATSDGDFLQTGFVYETDDSVDLYNTSGELVGNIELDGECLLVIIDGNTEYYYRESNSVAQ